MDFENRHSSSREQLGSRVADRLALYQHQLTTTPNSPRDLSKSQEVTRSTTTPKPATATMMARDPITCHVLNTLTGTPAANLPVTLTLLSPVSDNTTTTFPVAFQATTDSDGRVKAWTSTESTSTTVPTILSSLPSADSKSNWSVRFAVGPWYEAQGIESLWPEVEVKFTVKGRGREDEEGWRHYHVPVLLGPWSYSTYRGS